MPSIIAATDFSEVAENAVHYACNLALAYNTGLTILHSYMIPVSFTDNPMPVVPIEEGKEIAEEQMESLVESMQLAYPGVQISSYITYGDVTGSLKEYVTETDPWMVVIGNSSHEGKGFWEAGNLLDELRKLPCPVMAVSPGIKYQPVKKICLTCDFHEIEGHLPASEIISLVQQTGASLHVLNVDHNNKHFGTDTPMESAILHDMLHAVTPEYHYADNEQVEEGIRQFIADNKMDWLLVTPHKYNFFTALFHKSHTKQILHHVNIPVIAIHEK